MRTSFENNTLVLHVPFAGYIMEIFHCQQVKDSWGPKKGVGVAENPRSGVGARGSSVKKG
jgi:hypothetical protein